VLSERKRCEVLSRIREIETFVVANQDGKISIGALCNTAAATTAELAKSLDAITPVLRTALVINWRESMMKVRYERFIRSFPEISTLTALRKIMDTTEPRDLFLQGRLPIQHDGKGYGSALRHRHADEKASAVCCDIAANKTRR
jgi:hypothetical protein